MAKNKVGRRTKRKPPAAARVGDHHVCRMETNGLRHKGGEILGPAARTVLIGDAPAARVGDCCWCDGDAFDVLTEGEPTVLIECRVSVRSGDHSHGGYVRDGDVTVRFGRARRTARRSKS